MIKKEKSKEPEDRTKEIEEKLLPIAIEIAKSGEGALFVIGEEIKYSKLLRQKVDDFNVFDRGSRKLLRSLAIIDGALVIDKQGNLVSYGAMIKSTRAFMGFGTRHAAAVSASKKGNTAVLCSEEEHKVKIFKDGKYIMQIDALQKNVEKNVSQITRVLESLGAGFLGTVGTAVLAPTLGITMIPGVIIFGGSYYALKAMVNKFRKK